ncbi:MAG TPA: hypothetical protein VJ376_09360 [Pseudomonadota bacterium]|nr:hypothetical protein [Pseudomonadota bacterium]
MLSARILVLFVHVTAVIVALGGSLFSTFVLAPVLAGELEPVARLRVSRRIVRRLGTIVLGALAILVATGMLNLWFMGAMSVLLAAKLVLVVIAIGLALYQYGGIGVSIWRLSVAGPSPRVTSLQSRFRRVGLTVGVLVLIIVYLSVGLTRVPGALTISMP